MKIKSFFAKILPLTISIFRNRMNKLEQAIHRLSEYIKGVSKTEEKILETQREVQASLTNYNKEITRYQELVVNCYKELQELKRKVEKDDSDILEKVNTIMALDKDLQQELGKVEKNHYYNNENETTAIHSFYEEYEKDTFTEAFLKLIQDMSQVEVAKIVCILQRQRMIRDKAGKNIDLYTKEEKDDIRQLKSYMESHTLRVADGLFCFDGYLLPRKHFESSVFYYKHGIDDLDVESKAFVKGKGIIDAGGFYGDSVLVLEELEPDRIYTFEAVTSNFEILNKTLELNHIENCTAVKVALGDQRGEVYFDVRASQSNMQTLDHLDSIEGKEKVDVITLDEYVEENDIEVGLIKVDVEGAEQPFLQGARKTIEKQRPILLLSIYHNADDFFNIKPMIESWGLDYTFKIHKPCDYTVSREVLLICERAERKVK